jgi:hypothetical protein
MTPLSKFLLVSTIGKIVAVLILSYAFIINTISAYDVSKKLDISLFSDSNYASNESSNIRTNIIRECFEKKLKSTSITSN